MTSSPSSSVPTLGLQERSRICLRSSEASRRSRGCRGGYRLTVLTIEAWQLVILSTALVPASKTPATLARRPIALSLPRLIPIVTTLSAPTILTPVSTSQPAASHPFTNHLSVFTTQLSERAAVGPWLDDLGWLAFSTATLNDAWSARRMISRCVDCVGEAEKCQAKGTDMFQLFDFVLVLLLFVHSIVLLFSAPLSCYTSLPLPLSCCTHLSAKEHRLLAVVALI
jgi:hypothetical protein